jgi:catechol 2,3-dioxygenase-like lactoylglutathione lyase family enzyme
VIIGAHVIVYSTDASADRAFFRDVLGYPFVDVGHDWLIFRLPPAEVAVHPGDENAVHELFLMTDDVEAEVATLADKGVTCSPITEARFGRLTTITLPGGGTLGLYQPSHPTALDATPS